MQIVKNTTILFEPKFGATHRQVLPETNKAPQAVACEAYSLALQDGLEPTTP